MFFKRRYSDENSFKPKKFGIFTETEQGVLVECPQPGAEDSQSSPVSTPDDDESGPRIHEHPWTHYTYKTCDDTE